MIQRFICMLLGHPWIERDVMRSLRHCPCGKSAITDEHWLAAWPRG